MDTSHEPSSIGKALDILEVIGMAKGKGLSISKIAQELNIPFSTAHRITSYLLERGFLYRDPKKRKLTLGAKLCYLGRIALESKNITSIALPIMIRIRNDLNETVNLYIKEGNSRICIEQAESNQPLKHSSPIGQKLPLWAGASGKCFLAFEEKQTAILLIKQAAQLTPNTITNQEKFMSVLDEIRKRGYAISEGEREEGVSSVAAPIFGSDGTMQACLAISGPSVRFKGKHLERIIQAALIGSREITITLTN